MSFIPLGVLAASGAGGGGSFESIATAVGTGSTGTLTFSGIPSTYKHLQIRGIARGTDTPNDFYNMEIQINGTSTGYSIHQLQGNGTAASAQGFASANCSFMAYVPQNGVTANVQGATVIDIHDYASTSKYKTVRSFNGVDNNGSGYIRLSSGLYGSTNAVTSIAVISPSLNFTSSTQFALYGIKG